jgi:hypothetical protein
MTRTPFEPHDDHDEQVEAADPGRGAPEQDPDFEAEGEEPDEVPEPAQEEGQAGEPPD